MHRSLHSPDIAEMDKSMLGDLDALPEEDKLRMTAMIDQLQIRDRYPRQNFGVFVEQFRIFSCSEDEIKLGTASFCKDVPTNDLLFQFHF